MIKRLVISYVTKAARSFLHSALLQIQRKRSDSKKKLSPTKPHVFQLNSLQTIIYQVTCVIVIMFLG